MSPQDEMKKLAAHQAVEAIRSGMRLGLGTGSTAAFVVDRIGELLASGALHDIAGVPTSVRTAEQAARLHIPLLTLDDCPELDLAIDGADEVDPALNLVKGRGGALLREKMVEKAAKRFLVVVDETKIVEALGGTGAMPVEVVQFASTYNRRRLERLGCEVKLRAKSSGEPFVTDNGNFILDCFFERPIRDPERTAAAIEALTGVVEHGLFIAMASEVIVAGAKGIDRLSRARASS
jgi:ribose 5-phosphate isomerase A